MHIEPKPYKAFASSRQNCLYDYIVSRLSTKPSEQEAPKTVSMTTDFFKAILAALLIELIGKILGF